MQPCVLRVCTAVFARCVRNLAGGILFLAFLSPPPVCPAQAQELGTEEDAGAEADAMRAIGHHATNADLQFLVLRSDNKYIRAVAARWLGERRVRTAQPELLAAMDDPEPYVQSSAALAYARIADCALPAELLALVDAARAHTRYVAIGAMLELQNRCDPMIIPDPRALLAGMRRLVADEDAEVRRDAIVLLRRLPPAVPHSPRVPLYIQGLSDRDSMVRLEATRALQGNTDERVVAALVQQLQDADPRVATAAIRSLGGVQNQRARAAIREMLQHRNAEFRLVAVQATVDMNDLEEVPHLLPLLSDRVPEVREAAVHAMGTLRPPNCAEYLLPLLRDRALTVRQTAARTLGILCPRDDPETARALAQAASDSNYQVAQLAVRALQCIRNEETLPDLIEALCRCPHSGPQVGLTRLLEGLTGEYPGTTCSAWRQWWFRHQRQLERDEKEALARAAESEDEYAE